VNNTANYYEVLGVRRDADASTVHSAFRRLSKILHPDTTILPVDEASVKFMRVRQAYEILADPIKRKEYDSILKCEQSSDTESLNYAFNKYKFFSIKTRVVDLRRPFSGGELFSLLLLVVIIIICLLLVIVFAFIQGKELQVWPTWLMTMKQYYL
tara:strand:- start:3856 stop:4320 length:465 start_codon:yes stop_codon:yes gene_type:complete